MYSPEFNHNDVELISRETAFKGFFSLDRLVMKHRLYQGGWSQPFTRELFCRGQAAGVLPAATVSTEAVVAHFDVVIRQLRTACFCTGSTDLAALKIAVLQS